MTTEEDSKVTFEGLGVCKELCQACDALGYKIPTKIQQETLPLALKGRDIIGIAQTGSGKTAAFALPILQALIANPQPFFAVVLAPTRELAVQISECFEALGAGMGVKSSVIVGGMDMVHQAIALAKRPHIVVGTPGRLLDHLENTKGFSLKRCRFLVMDEADRLLDMDFGADIDKILKVIPKSGDATANSAAWTRRTFLFSATMTNNVAKLQRASLTDPARVEVSAKYATVDTLAQYYTFLPAKHKDAYLVYALTELAGHSIIVFVSTCANAQRISLLLKALRFGAIALHGHMSQSSRLASLASFKASTSPSTASAIDKIDALSKSKKEANAGSILIATDVASRGLDIPSVDCVLNFDLPSHSKDYIHRVGRTARAGRSGKAINFITQYDIETYQRIEELLGKKLPSFDVPKEGIEILMERVQEAQRFATTQMKEIAVKAKAKKSKSRS